MWMPPDDTGCHGYGPFHLLLFWSIILVRYGAKTDPSPLSEEFCGEYYCRFILFKLLPDLLFTIFIYICVFFFFFCRTVSFRSWGNWTTATLCVCVTSSTPVEIRQVPLLYHLILCCYLTLHHSLPFSVPNVWTRRYSKCVYSQCSYNDLACDIRSSSIMSQWF